MTERGIHLVQPQLRLPEARQRVRRVGSVMGQRTRRFLGRQDGAAVFCLTGKVPLLPFRMGDREPHHPFRRPFLARRTSRVEAAVADLDGRVGRPEL